jgi:hypothetical protein
MKAIPWESFSLSPAGFHDSRSVKAWLSVARIHVESCLTMQTS